MSGMLNLMALSSPSYSRFNANVFYLPSNFITGLFHILPCNRTLVKIIFPARVVLELNSIGFKFDSIRYMLNLSSPNFIR